MKIRAKEVFLTVLCLVAAPFPLSAVTTNAWTTPASGISGTNPEFAGYLLSDGALSAQNLQGDDGATFRQTGGALTVPGLITLANGAWLCNTGRQQVGQLRPQVPGGSNSVLTMPTGACVIPFAESSLVPWSNQATLTRM